jgi:predicted transcriptional regulator
MKPAPEELKANGPSKIVSINIAIETLEKIDAIATRRRRSRSQVIGMALEQYSRKEKS